MSWPFIEEADFTRESEWMWHDFWAQIALATALECSEGWAVLWRNMVAGRLTLGERATSPAGAR